MGVYLMGDEYEKGKENKERAQYQDGPAVMPSSISPIQIARACGLLRSDEILMPRPRSVRLKDMLDD